MSSIRFWSASILFCSNGVRTPGEVSIRRRRLERAADLDRVLPGLAVLGARRPA